MFCHHILAPLLGARAVLFSRHSPTERAHVLYAAPEQTRDVNNGFITGSRGELCQVGKLEVMRAD